MAFGAPKKPATHALFNIEGVSFATLNVRGLCSKEKCFYLLEFLQEKRLDIVALQETKISCLERLNIARSVFVSTTRFSIATL